MLEPILPFTAAAIFPHSWHIFNYFYFSFGISFILTCILRLFVLTSQLAAQKAQVIPGVNYSTYSSYVCDWNHQLKVFSGF